MALRFTPHTCIQLEWILSVADRLEIAQNVFDDHVPYHLDDHLSAHRFDIRSRSQRWQRSFLANCWIQKREKNAHQLLVSVVQQKEDHPQNDQNYDDPFKLRIVDVLLSSRLDHGIGVDDGVV